MKREKRIVTITIEGEVDAGFSLSEGVADILEKHANDIRDKDSIAGQSAKGQMTYATGRKYETRLDWVAKYEQP